MSACVTLGTRKCAAGLHGFGALLVAMCAGCGPLAVAEMPDPDGGGDPVPSGAAGWSNPPAPGCPVRSPVGAVELPQRIIIMVGDGMGPEQVAAGRVHSGGVLRMDELAAHTRLATDSWSTFNIKGTPPTDSAAAASAFASGQLVRNGHLGLSPDGEELTSVLDLAQQRGYATGLVTTSYLYDATPMAFAVHVDSRSLYDDIIVQLIERPLVDVVLGGAGGLLGEAYLPWRQQAADAGYGIVTDAPGLLARDGDEPTLGLFVGQVVEPPTDLRWWTTPAHRRGFGETDPSLSQMAAWSLDLLSRRSESFLLLIEDEHTDELGHISASHPELARESIAGEVAYFDSAVGTAIDWVGDHGSFDDTLLIVLADHETGGYLHSALDSSAGTFQTNVHTHQPVDLFASGPGAEHLEHMCRLTDVFALMTGRVAEL